VNSLEDQDWDTVMGKLSRFAKRKSLAMRKRIWKWRHNHAPDARPMFILGAQRSGTTMLTQCLNQSLEIDVFGEASKAMENWRLKDLESISTIITTSHCKAVVFKPLTDSHRAAELLALSPHAIICWAYRRAADRANSAVAKFGSNNLEHLSAFVRGERLDTWQAQGLSNDSLRLLQKYDFSNVSRHTAAGLFWYIRNALFFEQQLDKSPRVIPIAYEDLVQNPARVIRSFCHLLGANYQERLVRDIHSKSVGRRESNLSEDVEKICEEMYERLHHVQTRRWHELGLDAT
jgi:LPS sulfotransferase NodH